MVYPMIENPNLHTVLTRRDLFERGFDKEKIRRYEKAGKLIKGYGNHPKTGAVMVGYKKTIKFFES